MTARELAEKWYSGESQPLRERLVSGLSDAIAEHDAALISATLEKVSEALHRFAEHRSLKRFAEELEPLKRQADVAAYQASQKEKKS